MISSTLSLDLRHVAGAFPLNVLMTWGMRTNGRTAQSNYEADDLFWALASVTARGAGTAWVRADAADPFLNDPANGHVAGQVTGTGYTTEIRPPWSVFEDFFGGSLVPEITHDTGYPLFFCPRINNTCLSNYRHML